MDWYPPGLEAHSLRFFCHEKNDTSEDRFRAYRYTGNSDDLPYPYRAVGLADEVGHLSWLLLDTYSLDMMSDEQIVRLVREADEALLQRASFESITKFLAAPFARVPGAISQQFVQARFRSEYVLAQKLSDAGDQTWLSILARFLPYWECENPEAGYIYCLHDQQGHYKLGRTKQLTTRIKRLATQPPFELTLEFAFKTINAVAYESHLHEEFAAQRLRGEWFMLSPEDLLRIRRHAWLPEPSEGEDGGHQKNT